MQIINYEKFISDITGCLEFQIGSDNKKIKKKISGSDIAASVIDEDVSSERIVHLADDYLKNNSQDEILGLIRGSINLQKDRYTLSHDGWRPVKGSKDSITIDDFVNFFRGLKIFYGYISQKMKIPANKEKVLIGVIAPAGQDIGKDIIRFAWMSAGYDVIDLGAKVKPKKFLQAVKEHNPAVLGVSCMLNGCKESLEELMQMLGDEHIQIPLIIGGIAVNPVIAYKLSNNHKTPVYYCKDVSEAESVMISALNKLPVPKVEIKEPSKYTADAGIVESAKNVGFTLYQIPLDTIVINEFSRDRCATCSQIKKERCPLEMGYEKQLPLKESKDFVNQFGFALLVLDPCTEDDLKEHYNNENDRRRWLGLIDIESECKRAYKSAFSYKFPLICPFCSIKECTLPKGSCQMEIYYRPTHESYNVNLVDTITATLGGIEANNYALILVGEKNST